MTLSDRKRVLVEARRLAEANGGSVDAEYMVAVEDGDIVKARSLVKKAAKAAGYNVGPVWHGTISGEFDEFAPEKVGRTGYPDTQVGTAFFFTTNRLTAASVASKGEGGSGEVRFIEAFLRLHDPIRYDPNQWGEPDVIDSERVARMIGMAREQGRDGVVYESRSMGDTYVVLSPEQIKLADAVTHDRDGNVIPLSKRFDRASKKITESQVRPGKEERSTQLFRIFLRTVADWKRKEIEQELEKFGRLVSRKNYELKEISVSEIVPSQEGEDYVNDSSIETARRIRSGSVLSTRPADVYPIILDEGLNIIDGNHRHAAAVMNGQQRILAAVPVGSGDGKILNLADFEKKGFHESSKRQVMQALLAAGPPNEWSGVVAGLLGPEMRKDIEALWKTLTLDQKKDVRAKWEKSMPTAKESVASRVRRLVESAVVNEIRPSGTDMGAKEGDWQYIDSSCQTVQQLQSLYLKDLHRTPGNTIYGRTVERYKKDPGEKYPVVYQDSETGEYIVDDGNHRIQASKELGKKRMLVWVRKGLTGGRPHPALDSVRNLQLKESAAGDALDEEIESQDYEPDPSPQQVESGNYKKAHVKVHGLDIAVENPKGTVRRGVSKEGKPWETELKHHYGYIKGTVGRDKDHVDVFLGPDPETTTVFVINQVDPKTGDFDEHKCMVGFKSEEAAKKGYLANYQKGWKGFGSIVAKSVDDFKAWLKSGKTKKLAESTVSDQTQRPSKLMTLDELRQRGYIPVWRGTDTAGFVGIRATEGGAMGSGVDFYTEPLPARSHATGQGGVLAGWVPRNAVRIGGLYKNVAHLDDVSKFIPAGKVPVDQTRDRDAYLLAAERASTEVSLRSCNEVMAESKKIPRSYRFSAHRDSVRILIEDMAMFEGGGAWDVTVYERDESEENDHRVWKYSAVYEDNFGRLTDALAWVRREYGRLRKADFDDGLEGWPGAEEWFQRSVERAGLGKKESSDVGTGRTPVLVLSKTHPLRPVERKVVQEVGAQIEASGLRIPEEYSVVVGNFGVSRGGDGRASSAAGIPKTWYISMSKRPVNQRKYILRHEYGHAFDYAMGECCGLGFGSKWSTPNFGRFGYIGEASELFADCYSSLVLHGKIQMHIPSVRDEARFKEFVERSIREFAESGKVERELKESVSLHSFEKSESPKGEVLYHASDDVFPEGKPNFDAYFGTQDWKSTFQNEFGQYEYEVILPERERKNILDLGSGSEDARYILTLWGGDGSDLDDFYMEDWVDKDKVFPEVKELGYEGVKLLDEYILSKKLIGRLEVFKGNVLKENVSMNGQRVFRGGKWGKGSFPGVFVSLDRSSAEQYGVITEFDLDPQLRILNSDSREAESLVKRFEVWSPDNAGFDNEDPMTDLFMFPNEEWVWFLKQKGYGATQLGFDIFVFDEKNLKKLKESRESLVREYKGPETVANGGRKAGFTDSPEERDEASRLGLVLQTAGPQFTVYSRSYEDGKELASFLRRNGYGKNLEQQLELSRLAGYSEDQVKAFESFLRSRLKEASGIKGLGQK